MVDTRAMNDGACELLAQYELEHRCVGAARPLLRRRQQVIAIARAVDLSGPVLILDEPTASLDTQEIAILFATSGD